MSDFWLGALAALAVIGGIGVAAAVIKGRPMPDLSGARIIPPPKHPRWHIWAISLYPAGGEQIVGGYRLRCIASFIARRLPNVSFRNARYVVRRANSAEAT